jgi:hypothetical protein
LVFGETDERNFRRIGKGHQTLINQYSEENEEDEVDEALLQKLRSQLERANQTIVNMRSKENFLRIR